MPTADCTIKISRKNLEKLVNGKLNPMTAFLTGKIKVGGNMAKVMMYQGLINEFARVSSTLDLDGFVYDSTDTDVGNGQTVGGPPETFTFSATSGQTYSLFVAGWTGTADDYTVTLTATNADGSDLLVRTSYVVVDAPSTGGGLYHMTFTSGTTVPGVGTVDGHQRQVPQILAAFFHCFRHAFAKGFLYIRSTKTISPMSPKSLSRSILSMTSF